jgi:hypothetical protein
MCLVASTVKPCSGIGEVIRELDNAMTGELLPALQNAKGCGILSTGGTALARNNLLRRGGVTIRNNQKG